ncbi:MAG: DUF1543 domain-containing protein [Hyphomonadaceae bacterium]|nr:DUF1543 domain-containing protein [Hyphomonadaceae bacterium]
MGRWIDEGLKLYAVFVGGSHARATIELHDVQFAVASRIEDTVPALRQRWWGTPSSLHIDAYAELRVVDGYSITPVPPGDAPKSDLALYFVNTGGYQDGVFGESHAYSFHVSADKKEVWRNAKQRAADFSSIHQDNFDRIDDVVCVDEVIEDQPWRLAYNLLPGSENAKPLIVARYKSL